MEKLSNETLVLTNKEFETIRKYKQIENLAINKFKQRCIEKETEKIILTYLVTFIFNILMMFVNIAMLKQIYDLISKLV